jgi:hypothetical protein
MKMNVARVQQRPVTGQATVRLSAFRKVSTRPCVVRQAGWETAMMVLAKAGDVEAPPYALFVGAAVAALVGGLGIPLALKPGQEASDKIIEAGQKQDKTPPKKK